MYRWLLIVCLAMVTAGYGSERELKYDTGTYQEAIWYDEGHDFWFGNEFNLSGVEGPT
jgi:hypothetical protein